MFKPTSPLLGGLLWYVTAGRSRAAGSGVGTLTLSLPSQENPLAIVPDAESASTETTEDGG